jgi:hypothetical protein
LQVFQKEPDFRISWFNSHGGRASKAMEISPFLQEVFTETEHGANEGRRMPLEFILSIRNKASYHRARAEQENSDAGTKAGLLASS